MATIIVYCIALYIVYVLNILNAHIGIKFYVLIIETCSNDYFSL